MDAGAVLHEDALLELLLLCLVGSFEVLLHEFLVVQGLKIPATDVYPHKKVTSSDTGPHVTVGKVKKFRLNSNFQSRKVPLVGCPYCTKEGLREAKNGKFEILRSFLVKKQGFGAGGPRQNHGLACAARVNSTVLLRKMLFSVMLRLL